MRKEYKRVLIENFTYKFLQRVNGFSKTQKRGSIGLITFAKRIEPSEISVFVRLFPDPKREAFTVEVGWTCPSASPDVLQYGQPSASRKEFKRADFICRVGSLCGQDDRWWHVEPKLNPFTDDSVEYMKRSLEPVSPEQALSRIAPLVEDALDKIILFGLPYLDEYLRASDAGQ